MTRSQIHNDNLVYVVIISVDIRDDIILTLFLRKSKGYIIENMHIYDKTTNRVSYQF